MKTIYLLSALFLLIVAPFSAWAEKAPGAAITLFVAPNGNDAWNGRLPAPDAQGSDGPLATLAHAQQVVRAYKSRDGLKPGDITVWVRGGTYELDATLAFTAEDSGTADAPIIYAAFPGESVMLSGGKAVHDWKEVTAPEALQRLDEAARKEVRVADLKAMGIQDYGNPDKDGLELFFTGTPMTLSRWPNEGFERIQDIVVDDGHQIHGIKGSTVGKFKYAGDRPKRWLGEQDPWAHGYWFWDWSDQRQRITLIDFDQKVLGLSEPYHTYGYRKDQWYYVFNVLSELDRPGEWYLDRINGLLYFWPTQWMYASQAVVSILPSLASLDGTSYLSLRGFTFEASRGTAVHGTPVDHVEIADCIVRNVGGDAISLSGKNSGAVGCEIYQTGSSGIVLAGGDRATLEPAGMYAENNHIHHYGRINRMYTPGVALNGVGNRVANNLIHSAPHMAIQFGGNDHVIEFNEIHHVCLESNDAGAIYAGRDWLMRGNVIRHNYLHHIEGFEKRGCVGVYLDDMFASASIYGNVFHQVTCAAFIGGGRDCSVENNIFVDCKPALHVDARALGWAAYHADEWIAEAKEKGTIKGLAYTQPPYSTKYPEVVKLLDDEPKSPKGNRIARNICWGGTWDDIEAVAKPYLAMESNWVQEDPHFVDAPNLDFRLKPDAPALTQGFVPIPMESIGLFKHGASDPSGFRALCDRTLDAQSATAPPHTTQKPSQSGADIPVCPDLTLARARQLRTQRNFDAARKMYKKAIANPALPPEKKWNARLELGHTGMAQRQYAKARSAYRALWHDKTAPPYLRMMAAVRAGETHAREGHADAAEKTWNKATNMQGIPKALLETDLVNRSGMLHSDGDHLGYFSQFEAKCAFELFVSPQGNDANPGTAEQPLATFEGAQQAVQKIKAKGPLPYGGIAVNFREGKYPVAKGYCLSDADSGEALHPEVGANGDIWFSGPCLYAPVVYRACNNEKVVFSGGKSVSGFAPVTDKDILKRLPEESHGKVLQTDLKAQGITDYGLLQTRGMGIKDAPPQLELFVDDVPMTLARWPNEGFVRTGKVIDAGSFTEKRGATFEYADARPARWKQANDIWLNGYWYWDWADCTLGVASIYPTTRHINTKQVGSYGLRENQTYYAFNLLEEIDRPGEYYLDRNTGILYLYPPKDLAQAKVELSMLEGPMLTLSNVSHVRFENLEFETGRSDAVVVRDGMACAFVGCLVRQFAGSGVRIQGGEEHGVYGSELHTLGRRGVELIGGDRMTLQSASHYVENCYIHNFSRIDRTYTPAVQIEGVGNIISHNHFSQSPSHAIRVEGNDHIIEYNEVDHVLLETDDQGGIDIWANPTYRGNIFRYNYWHDMGNGRPCGQAGIRLDDAISGTLMYGNIFQRCSGANFGGVQIHGGKDNWVDNNIFIDCPFAVSFSSWGEKRWKDFLASDLCQGYLKAVEPVMPLYLQRYPELADLEKNPDVNNVWRNIVINGQLLLRDNGKHHVTDNWVTAEDPGFIDAATNQFDFRTNAPALDQIGFNPIPFSKIGTYPSPLARWKKE